MQLKSILNRVQKHPSFVYETVRLVEHPRLTLEVRVRPRAGTRATCSQCRRRAPGYDTQAVRRFDFVPLWHIPVVFLYTMRRVSCPGCGVAGRGAAVGHRQAPTDRRLRLVPRRVGQAPVVAGGRRGRFPTSWDTVYRAVRRAVDWGLAHRDLTNIEAIGVDELSRRRGQRYLTLVYQIDGHCKRLFVGRTRTQGRDVGGLLRLVRPRTQRGAVLRLLGHVEALPEGGRRARRGRRCRCSTASTS